MCVPSITPYARKIFSDGRFVTKNTKHRLHSILTLSEFDEKT